MVENENLSILFGIQDGGEISYFQIFSSSNEQTEADIAAVKEYFKKRGISYTEVKSQAISQIQKSLKI